MRKQAPEKVAVEKHLYSWILPDGNKDISAEDTFGKIETDFPGVRTKLEQRNLISREEFDPLIAFVSSQIYRVPSLFGTIKQRIPEWINARNEELFKDQEKAEAFARRIFGEDTEDCPTDLVDIRKRFAELADNYPPENCVVPVMFDLMRESYSMLCQKASITIIHSPQQRAFITSDRPVIVLKRDPAALGVAGFLGRGSSVFMPISKRIALLMRDGRSGIVHREANRAELNHFNRDLAFSSVRFLFGDDYQRLLSIVGKARLNQRSPGPSIGFPDIS